MLVTTPQKVVRALRINTIAGAEFEVDFPRKGQKVCRWHRTTTGNTRSLKLRTAHGILTTIPKVRKGEPLVLIGKPLTAGLAGAEASVAFREIRTAPVEKISAIYLDDDNEENGGYYTC